MSAHTSGEWMLLYITIAETVAFLAYLKQLWARPLINGSDFFLGVQGPSRVLRRRGSSLAEALACPRARLALSADNRSARHFLFWPLVPLPCVSRGRRNPTRGHCRGGTAHARAKLGTNPPVLSSVAIPLEARRLGNYISWPGEAALGGITALSWILLLTQGGAPVHWDTPVIVTYVIWGLLPFKIMIARHNLPIPAERPEEHHKPLFAPNDGPFSMVLRRSTRGVRALAQSACRWRLDPLVRGWGRIGDLVLHGGVHHSRRATPDCNGP